MFQKFPMLRESESISQVSLHQIRLHQITSLQQNLEHNHAWKKITTSPSPTHIWGCFLLYSYYSETGLTLTSKNTCQANTWEPPSMGSGCNCIQRRCTSSSLPSPIPLLGGISWENPSCTGAYSIEHDLESRHLTCPSVLGTSFCQPSPYLFNPPPCYFNPPRPYFFQPSCLNMSIYEVLVLEEPWTGIDKNGTYSNIVFYCQHIHSIYTPAIEFRRNRFTGPPTIPIAGTTSLNRQAGGRLQVRVCCWNWHSLGRTGGSSDPLFSFCCCCCCCYINMLTRFNLYPH